MIFLRVTVSAYPRAAERHPEAPASSGVRFEIQGGINAVVDTSDPWQPLEERPLRMPIRSQNYLVEPDLRATARGFNFNRLAWGMPTDRNTIAHPSDAFMAQMERGDPLPALVATSNAWTAADGVEIFSRHGWSSDLLLMQPGAQITFSGKVDGRRWTRRCLWTGRQCGVAFERN